MIRIMYSENGDYVENDKQQFSISEDFWLITFFINSVSCYVSEVCTKLSWCDTIFLPAEQYDISNDYTEEAMFLGNTAIIEE